MSTKTSSGSTVGTLVVIGVLIAAATFWANGHGTGVPAREDTQDNIVLEVHFNPYPRAIDSLHLVATVEGVMLHDEHPDVSPWVKSEWIPKGSKIVLSAWQTSKGTLQCIIRHKGKTVAEQWTDKAGGGIESRVTCIYRSVT